MVEGDVEGDVTKEGLDSENLKEKKYQQHFDEFFDVYYVYVITVYIITVCNSANSFVKLSNVQADVVIQKKD